MGTRRIFLTVLAAAALFGLAIPGCNRERDRRMADSGGSAVGTGAATRPAEVLSSVVHRARPGRSGTRGLAPLPPAPRLEPWEERQLAAYEPLPEPVPMGAPAYAYPHPRPQPYYAPVPVSSPTLSEPYTLRPSRTDPSGYEKVYERSGSWPLPAHSPPALTVARAQLQGSAPMGDPAWFTEQRTGVPLPTPESFPVPIPELEPMRYTRAGGSQAKPAVAAFPAPRQAQPLPPTPSPAARPQTRPLQGWVASPATAMRNTRN